MNKRYGKKRVAGCECDDRFTCRRCLDAALYPLDPYGYAQRVRTLEGEGLTTSDAQGVADVEFSRRTTPPI